MEKVFCNAKRILLICALIAVAAVLCLCLFSPTVLASAENYSLGTKDPLNAVTVYYGDQASYAPFHPHGSSIWVRFVHYVGTPDGSNVPIDLVDESDRFIVEPGCYYVNAYSNIQPCDQNGILSDVDTCTGTVILNVVPKQLSICFDADALVKGYGETVATDVENNLPWSFANPEEEDAAITLRFSSDGFAASAPVGSYEIITPVAVFLNHEDRSEYYQVQMSVKDSSDPVLFSVTPKEVAFVYDKNETRPFNDYLFEGSVDTLSRVFANGDAVTALFRLKEPPQNGVLTVDASYELEYYGYTVTPSGGETTFYEAGVPSDYSVTVNFETDRITATKGSLVIYADESKRDERAGSPKYLYLSPSLPYLDDAIKNYQEVVPFLVDYYGTQLALNCKVQGAVSGALPCGDYSLTVASFACDLLISEADAVTFEGGTLPLRVTPRVLVYDGESTVEYGAWAVYEQRVEVAFEDQTVGFTLSAEVGSAAVGTELSYLSALSDDPYFALSFDQAKLSVVKRSTGVSAVAETQNAYYGCVPERFASLWLDHGTDTETSLTSEFSYSYKSISSASSYAGLPSEVGSYLVTCTVLSDRYETDPITVPLTIAKRPVLAVFSIYKAEKVYHTTFTFVASGNNRTVQLLKLYAYEGGLQGEEIKFTSGDFGGTILTSDGAAEEATVGEYEYDCSGAISPKYQIEKATVKVGTQDVQTFKVVKAPAPAAPALEPKVEDREIKIMATERMELQISTSEDFDSYTTKKGKELSYIAPVYGQVYYLRMRVSDDVNYEANGAWATASVAISFPKPTVSAEEEKATSVSLTFSASMPTKSVVEGYVLKYRVNSSGAWQEGNVVTGLSAATTYKIAFRYEKGGVIGKETEVTATTLRAPVEEKQIKYFYDRETGKLTLSADLSSTVEYLLCSASGEALTEWVSAQDLPLLEADSEYLLKVRIAASGGTKHPSDIREIKVDTHKAKEPLTFKKIFSDWFLLIVGGILLVTTVILLVSFIKSKRKTDREELGGK